MPGASASPFGLVGDPAIRRCAAILRRPDKAVVKRRLPQPGRFDGRFHPCGPEWWDLDRHDSDETRERWKLNWLADRLKR
jgi:hypothetical protein